MAAKWRLNDSQTDARKSTWRQKSLAGRNKLYLFFEACLLTIDHFSLRLLFICERYFDQKWSKKEENHLNDFRVRSGGKCIYRSLGLFSSSILRLCSPPPSS